MLIWVCSCLQLSEKWIKILPSCIERRKIRYRSVWEIVFRHLTVPVFAKSTVNWFGLTSYHKNHPGMRPCCSSRRIGLQAAMNTRKWYEAPPVDSYQWNNSFLQRMLCELVIWPSFDGKITSEPNETGCVGSPLARFYIRLTDTVKVCAVFNMPLCGWQCTFALIL